LDFKKGLIMKIEKHILNALDLLKTIEDELRKNCVKILKLKEVKEHLVEACKCIKKCGDE